MAKLLRLLWNEGPGIFLALCGLAFVGMALWAVGDYVLNNTHRLLSDAAYQMRMLLAIVFGGGIILGALWGVLSTIELTYRRRFSDSFSKRHPYASGTIGIVTLMVETMIAYVVTKAVFLI